VIDEVGFEPMTRQEASLFFRLVSYRYGRGVVFPSFPYSSGR
jgi:DNA replication protein DnaC